MDAGTIKVLLVDDHTVVRNGVCLMLSSAPDIEVVAEATSATEAIRMVNAQRFDVALVDIALPGQNGLDLLKRLQITHPDIAVLILSTYAEEIYAMRALKLGAAGYLTKDSSAATLIGAVRKASTGGKYVSSSLAERFASAMSGKPGCTHEILSDRELEVLKLLALGESLVVIAERLNLSPKTVSTYRSRILEKMGLSSNAELTRYALENGLVS